MTLELLLEGEDTVGAAEVVVEVMVGILKAVAADINLGAAEVRINQGIVETEVVVVEGVGVVVVVVGERVIGSALVQAAVM